MNKKTKQMNI